MLNGYWKELWDHILICNRIDTSAAAVASSSWHTASHSSGADRQAQSPSSHYQLSTQTVAQQTQRSSFKTGTPTFMKKDWGAVFLLM